MGIERLIFLWIFCIFLQELNETFLKRNLMVLRLVEMGEMRRMEG